MTILLMFDAETRRCVVGLHPAPGQSFSWTVDEGDGGMFNVVEGGIGIDVDETTVLVDEPHAHIASRITDLADDRSGDFLEQVGAITRILAVLY